jgi:DNA-binding transcriptional regulator LsrR (DeoR family)
VEDETQAEVAKALDTSWPTVSRLLADARATGIVRIRVLLPVPTGIRALADEPAKAPSRLCEQAT